jgi:glycosyltransferase involved in cell wall biosynthesis
MASALVFVPFLCRGKFDLIFFSLSPIAEGIPAVVLKLLKRAFLVFWVQDLWPESLSASKVFQNSFFHNIIRKIVSLIYNSCDKILVQSRSFIPFIAKMGILDERISYFPNFAEDFYKPLDLSFDAPERKNIPRGFIVMFAGNIGASQDFPTIISAVEKVKDYSEIHWVIIGDGRMRKWAENEIARRNLNPNFIFLGRHPPEQMPRYFALADVLLVTLKDEEIFALTIPAKVQSYLACAKPIIASLAGEGAKIIEESQAGFFCSPENPSALAELVLKMYHMDARERQAMGLNGRKYFENNFCRKKLINELDSVLEGAKGVKA